jgi:peptidoglycan/xylan/chitin deacetylase (PgdA/CDA1 family)
MPAERRPGSDNPYVPWSPLPFRPLLRWPDEARVAVCVIVSLERLEWAPPAGVVVPPSGRYGGPYPVTFDPLGPGLREFGNRVGVFRVMDVLDRLGVRACVAMDASLAASTPFLVDQCRRREWEFMGHGVAFSRMITAAMDEDEERAYLKCSLDTIAEASGQRPRGWIGADYGESGRTVALLAELGVEYVCDWPNDEQPYRMQVPQGTMVSLPASVELDAVFTHRLRGIPIDRWRDLVRESFDELHADGETTGRLLVLNVHPYLLGQAFRVRYFEEALTHIVRSPGVWLATGSEITDWYLRDAAPA